jgi:hypothetical protein
LLAFRQIGSVPSKAFLPTIALPPAAGGWMNAVRRARAMALGLVVASALCASPASSADRVAKSNGAQAGYFPIRCDDPAVRARIAAEYRARHRVSDLAAVDILDARVTTPKYWPDDMPRRFCEGIVPSPSGPERLSFHPPYYPIYYAIIANGPGYELEWCVVGLDRAWPYDPRCRLARP